MRQSVTLSRISHKTPAQETSLRRRPLVRFRSMLVHHHAVRQRRRGHIFLIHPHVQLCPPRVRAFPLPRILLDPNAPPLYATHPLAIWQRITIYG